MSKDKQTSKSVFLFGKKNYLFMFIGIAFIAIGGSDDPAVFNEAMYNFQRIRLAPTLVIIGLAIEIYAILLNPSK